MSTNGVKLLRSYDILKRTDENHPLTAEQISALLYDRWGIEAERKSIQRYIRDLTEVGVDIMKHPDNKRGFYIGGREFSDWELKVLIDAAESAEFLSSADTDRLVGKLLAQASDDSARTLKLMRVPADAKRGDNTVKYTIDTVLRAMAGHRQVLFEYVITDADGRKIPKHPDAALPVSPYALIWRKDRYYLIGCWSREAGLSYYRLDRIRNITVPETGRAIPLKDILGGDAERELREFVKKNIYNKKGSPVTIKLRTERSCVDTLYDSFGEKIMIMPGGDGTVTATVNVSDSEGLYTWLLHNSSNVTAVSPPQVCGEMRRRLRELLKRYEEM